MTKVLACIDGSLYGDSVADHAAWAAVRLGVAVELLQVIGPREVASTDRSGRIVAGARRKLLEELAALDAERAKLMHKEAWLALDEAKARVEKAGAAANVALRHGDLLETLDEREAEAALVVVGKRGEAADFAKGHLGSNLERMVRATRRPMLIASRAFRPVGRALVAFDGRRGALEMVDAVSRSPLFAGLSVLVVTAGTESPATAAALDKAVAQLAAGGLTAEGRVVSGRPDAAIAAAVETEGIDLLAMGAWGHSRLRTMMIGSTTEALLRACKVPVVVFR